MERKLSGFSELCLNNLEPTSCLRNNHVVGMVRDPAHYGESDTRGVSQRTKYAERWAINNGIRIFEGDIIQVKFESDAELPSEPTVWYENYEVYFDDEHHEWGVRMGEYTCNLWEYDQDCIVIGNVHDSPELLSF